MKKPAAPPLFSGPRFRRFIRPWLAAWCAGWIVLGCALAAFGAEPARWWKGNLHTHSLWSDGDAFPEMIAEWYKTNGYHFLGLSDHNVVLEGEKWIPVATPGRRASYQRYFQRFGNEWVETRMLQNTQQVRLKGLEEFRKLIEEPERFLMIPSEEISASFDRLPLHLNATNLRKLIRPQKGSNVLDVLQRNVDAVLAQRRETGQPMFPHINHPNFGWAVTVEDLMRVQGEKFFEVYNGHPQVHNLGDEYRPGVERMWDILLAFRLTRLGLGPMYGLAVDDSHNYHQMARTNANPGRGWVMVRAARLAPEAIVGAMEAGDFYASSGVRLKDVRREADRLTVEIEPERGVDYTTMFIGTFKDFDPASEPGTPPPGSVLAVSRQYSSDIGTVLAEVKGTSASYKLRGGELYVRAKVTSSKPKANPYAVGEVEAAWTQPLIPASR